jgi:mRNA-degrading endonuclease toxin of MazEF toxin-antitoxin module
VPADVLGHGDLIWTDFDPTKGREQAGRRPALVVSSAAFTENTGLAPLSVRLRSAFGRFRPVLFSHQAYRSPARS